MQVIKVTVAILLLMICAFFSLRFYGLSQQYQVYDHPLMKKPLPWVLAWGGDWEAGPSHSLTALRAAAQDRELILAINIQMNKEKHFFAIPSELTHREPQPLVSEMTDTEVKNMDLGSGQHPLMLEEIITEFPQSPLLLWVSDNLENVDLRLEPLIKKHPQPNLLMIHSEYDNVLKSLKTLIPDLLYGTGVGQRVRALMLSSLRLEPIATLDGDFLISPLKGHGVVTLSETLKQEFLRRKKLTIIGPLLTQESNDLALKIGADGYLTAYPRDLKKKLLR